MKLTFTFTDVPDISSVSRNDLYQTHLELPDAVLQMAGAKEQVLTIAGLVGQLTCAALHITCKELGLKNHPIKLTVEENPASAGFTFAWQVIAICFRAIRGHPKLATLKIRAPINSPVTVPQRSKRHKQLEHNLIRPPVQATTAEQQKYLATIQTIAECCVLLLNSGPLSRGDIAWSYVGFHPYWMDAAAITLFNTRSKKRQAEERVRERQAEKQQQRDAKMAQAIADGQKPPPVPKTGAGRRIGAVPGTFKGVQFRSQLEIRFVTELENKGIRWVYESERLGESNYLVDFYLPNLKCWVEVKGRLAPRDDYFLKEIAAELKRERGEKLFVYTSGKAFRVTAGEFMELTRSEFWVQLVR